MNHATKLGVVAPPEIDSSRRRDDGGGGGSKRRDGLFAFAGIVLGAILAFGFDLLKNRVEANTPLDEHAPSVAVSRLFVSTPEVLVPNVSVPVPPSEIRRRIDDLENNLLLTNSNVTIRLSDAQVVSGFVHRSHALNDIDTPLGYIDIDAWRQDIGNATASIASSYSRRPTLQKLYDVATSVSSNDEKQRRFEAIAAESSGVGIGQTLRDVAVFYGASNGTDVEKKLVARMNDRVKTGARQRWYIQDFDDGSILYLGAIPASLSAKNGAERTYVRDFVRLFTMLSWDDVGLLIKFGIDGLQNEVDVLTNFLTKSHELISEKLSPRVRIETVLVNESRSPATIKPYGALQLGMAGKDSALFVVPVHVSGASLGEKDELQSKSPEAIYVTLAPGAAVRVEWTGSIDGNVSLKEKWPTVRSAYDSGTLTAVVSVETVTGKFARSADAQVGKPLAWSLESASKLAGGGITAK